MKKAKEHYDEAAGSLMRSDIAQRKNFRWDAEAERSRAIAHALCSIALVLAQIWVSIQDKEV